VNIKFCFKLGKPAVEMQAMLETVSENEALSFMHV
jgi:hypothetical protein